ncbi:MAG: GNAT family N-acetyltransferase [Chloroflexi bacterium]|jgi:putative acetyltransferase|nr:GNAT family N-acetyltransferase [Chloroflexota bacterium]
MSKKSSHPTILIRGQEADDWEDIAALSGSPQVVYHTLQMPFVSRDVIRERTENSAPNRQILVAVVGDQVVGMLGLHIGSGRQAHLARLGMMVRDDFHGQGVGSALMEAAIELAEKWFDLHRIELEVFVDNQPALALYRKFGFEIEGTVREYAFRDGEYVDSYIMARIRSEEQA